MNSYGEKVTFLGAWCAGLSKNNWKEGLCTEYSFCGLAHKNRQSAAAVGALAMQYLKEGKTETAMEHQPDYLRLSQAERERAEKNANLS